MPAQSLTDKPLPRVILTPKRRRSRWGPENRLQRIEASIAHVVRKRLIRAGLSLPYPLTKALVRLVFDVLGEQIPGVMEGFLSELRLRHKDPADSVRRLERGVRLFKVLRQHRRRESLDAETLAALEDARLACKLMGDKRAMTAVARLMVLHSDG